MFGLELNAVLILVLVVALFAIDKLVTWRLTQKGIDAAKDQIPLTGVAELFEGFAKLPVVQAGYDAGMSQLKKKAAATESPLDDGALEWIDERGRRWFREDHPVASMPVVKRDPAVDRVGES